jgi:hypothetical protein
VLASLGAWKGAIIAVVAGITVVGTALVLTPKSNPNAQDNGNLPAVVTPVAPRADGLQQQREEQQPTEAVTGETKSETPAAGQKTNDAAPSAAPSAATSAAPTRNESLHSARSAKTAHAKEDANVSQESKKSDAAGKADGVIELDKENGTPRVNFQLNQPNKKK